MPELDSNAATIREIADHLQRRMSNAERCGYVMDLYRRIHELTACADVLVEIDCPFADQTRMSEHIRRICGLRIG